MSATVVTSASGQQGGIFEPAYLCLLRSGELAERARLSRCHLENCDLCVRYCKVNRRQSICGAICRTGEQPIVYSAEPHHGARRIACAAGAVLGTISFSWCNLRCIFCQHWEIAWQGEAKK